MTRPTVRRSWLSLAVVILLLAVPALLLTGCPAKRAAMSPAGAPPMPGSAAPKAALESADRAAGGAPAPTSELPPVDLSQARAGQKIIWKAEYTLRVDDASAAARQFRAAAEQKGGFVSGQEKELQESGGTVVSVEVRVPSAQFWPLLESLEGLGEVKIGKTSSENVTEEFVDLEGRLANSRREESRLADLMSRAGSLEDLLTVERRLSEVQGEIEKIQGRMRFLENQIALSTIHVQFLEKGVAAVGKLAPFSPGSVLLRALHALVRALEVVFTLVLFVALPGAVIWVPLLLIVRALRRRRQRKAPPQPEPPA